MAFRNQVLQQPHGQAILVAGRPDNHDLAWVNKQIEQLIHVRAVLPQQACLARQAVSQLCAPPGCRLCGPGTCRVYRQQQSASRPASDLA